MRSADARGLALGALLLAAAPAWAVLGGDIATVQADAQRLQGVRRASAALDHTVHEIVRPDGGRLRQYANAQGRVFMVRWNQPGKPRLADLLGDHATAYRAAVSQVAAQPGLRRQARIEVGDLVVQSTVFLDRHDGSAWLKSQLPASLAAQARR